MKAKIKSSGALVEVQPLWYMDTKGIMYKNDEIDIMHELQKENDDANKFFDSLYTMQEMSTRREWEDKRFALVLKLIEIYQAPAANMEDIINLANKYIENLRK